MPYNITLEVIDNEDGSVSVKVDETASYIRTAPRGKFVLTGHVVGESEGGRQYVGVTTPLGERVSSGHDVKTPV